MDEKMLVFLNTRGFLPSGSSSWRNGGIDITILTNPNASLAIILCPTAGCMFEEYKYLVNSKYDIIVFDSFKHKVVHLIQRGAGKNPFSTIFTK